MRPVLEDHSRRIKPRNEGAVKRLGHVFLGPPETNTTQKQTCEDLKHAMKKKGHLDKPGQRVDIRNVAEEVHMGTSSFNLLLVAFWMYDCDWV